MVKRFISISILAVLLVSCGPSRHAIHVEMRHPSRSGMELAGKIVSVISMDGEDERENLVCGNMADAFAKALEEGYGTGEGSVGLFCVDRNSDYTSRDSLVSLLMQTGSDVVFLMDVSSSGSMTSAGLPVKVSIYAYDAMDKEEKVKHFTGTKVLAASTDEGLVEEASKTGKLVADPFESQWKQEQYSVAYYDTAKWYESVIRAEQYDWKGAMDIWIELLDTRDLMKKASAEYNIAVACYMMGDYYLAEEWLERSDADNKLPTLSDGLRKRIEARKQ
jgi:hypothetical protein